MVSNETSTLEQVSDGLAAAVERAAASTVLVSARRRIPASGVIWAADGLIVTADHVIEDEDEITVGLADDREVEARLVGRDPGSDLAALRVDATDLRAAEPAPAGATKVGHLVLAVGRPTRGGVQASVGVVSAISHDDGGTLMTIEAPAALMSFIVEKGSITVDGVSLTVAAMTAGSFSVALIPQTLDFTTLGLRKPGDTVNLENDVIAKYVERLLEARE